MENANKPISHGPINPERFSPFPKNPNIARFFVQLGRVEELGSGVRNVTRYLKNYRPGGKAEFVEEDVFRTAVPVPLIGNTGGPARLLSTLDILIARLTALDLADNVNQRLAQELGVFSSGEAVSASDLAGLLGVNVRTIRRDFNILREAGMIEPSTNAEYGNYQISPLLT